MLGNALRKVRQYHGFGLSEAASELGLSKSYLSEIESGQKTPTLKVLEKYSKVFQIPVSNLLFFSEKMKADATEYRTRQIASEKILKIMDKFFGNSGQN